MEFTQGTPEKIDGKQYVLEFHKMPCFVGMWNGVEQSWVLATPQCSMNDGSLHDCCYEIEWVEDVEIKGYCELP